MSEGGGTLVLVIITLFRSSMSEGGGTLVLVIITLFRSTMSEGGDISVSYNYII